MHLVYIDESGDLGAPGASSRHFILSALLVPHEHWGAARLGLLGMRANLDALYGLRTGAEIHAAQFLGGADRHHGLDVRRRFQCAHHVLGHLAKSPHLRPVRVALEKGAMGGRPLLDLAWSALLEEVAFEIRQLPGNACGSRGLVAIMDHHGAMPYRPSAGLPAEGPLLELPFGRRSEDSDLLQCADLLGFLTKQSLDPNRYFLASHGRRLIRRMERLYSHPCRRIGAK